MSPFDELTAYVVLFLIGCLAAQKRREEEQFKDEKHQEELDENQHP